MAIEKRALSSSLVEEELEARPQPKVQKSTTFADSTGAFFNELSEIIKKMQSEKEEGLDLRSDRPYSALLTQDEEPIADYSPMQLDWQEPEVITRGGT